MKATRQHQPLVQPKTTSSSSNHATTSQPFFAKTGTPSRSQPEPFFKAPVQTKLTVGRADDRFEREADATADRVMRMPAPNPSARPFFPASGLLQPKSDEKEKKEVRRKEADTDTPVIQLKTEEEDKKKIQKKGDSATPAVNSGFESQLSASQSGGQPLSADTRQFMEPRFGADFSGVRVHTDAPAVQMSQSIGAQAFAYQNHVYFNEGKYSPGTRSGQHLLAHELTHVVQQGAAIQRKPLISSAMPAVQRLFGLDVAGTIDGWLANLPGWRLLTVLAGYNPVLQREVPRSTTNLIEGFLTLGGPIGVLLFNKLRTEGIVGRMADWIDTQVATLGISYAYIRGLFSQAWDDMGITLGISGNLDIIRRVFAPPFDRITAFVRRVISQVVVFIKETIVRPLSTRARQMRGFTLLTVIIGKDPFTDEVVERSPTNLVGGFMSLMENGDERFRQMQQSGALQRAFTWFNVETTRRNLTWERIKGIFTAVWNALTPEAVLHPLETISRIAGLFFGLAADIAGFAGAALLQMLEFIFEAVMGAGGARVLAILKRARATFLIIIRDPVRFVGNLVRAGVQGFRQFMQNALTHLQRGLVGWLLGALEGAGLTLPQTFDLHGILSLVLQILGLTYQNIRAKLVRATSEQFVSRMEQVFDFLRILITQGPAAAWQKIVEYLGNLRNMVLDGVIAWVRQTVIGQAIIRIASMLNPAGAVIQAIMATYNTVMFFVERINQIAAVVESYVDSMAAIAAGNIVAAANRVETTMGRMVPVMISFLARLLGLGGISNTIRNTIARIRQPVDRALDRVVDWVVAQGRRLVGRVTGGTPAERVNSALATAIPIVNRFAGRPVTSVVLMPLLAALKVRYQLSLLEVIPTDQGVWAVRAAASPPTQQNTQAQVPGAGANASTTPTTLVPIGSWIKNLQMNGFERVSNQASVLRRIAATGQLQPVSFLTDKPDGGGNTLSYSGEGTQWQRTAFTHGSSYVMPAGSGAGFVLKMPHRGSAAIRPNFYNDSSSSRSAIVRSKLPALLHPTQPTKFLSDAPLSDERREGYMETFNGKAVIPIGKASADHTPSLAEHWTNNQGNSVAQAIRLSWNQSAGNYRITSSEYNIRRGSGGTQYTEVVGISFRGPNEP
ncbi:eCIS core domain-containing protein [Larkinella punicea]|uniref:DUF4157 domain-containing protein n=1 Tax=Larkinella punicea TaxID=2315727 RepID=A0A368JPQ8_9BACT|nr:DUF4157 domain-containing protein [Larkinella punicea]RCR69482.1 DUF4157 domain-containing protein [Larkinella punicea]